MGIRHTGGINNNGKAFLHIKTYYSYFCTSSKQFLHTTTQPQYLTKIQIQIFFSQTQLKQQHKNGCFLYNCSLIVPQ